MEIKKQHEWLLEQLRVMRSKQFGSSSDCKENDVTTPILQTPKEPALIPGSYASAEAVAHIAVQKFVMGSPLYRQEQEWNRHLYEYQPGRRAALSCSA